MTAPPPGPGGKAYIFLNGDFEPPPDWPARPGPADLVAGADGGGRIARSLGWPVHLLAGDFDSLDEASRTALAAEGAEVFRRPAAKDETDFELALALVRARGFLEIDVLGALGGRWDMTFANLQLPAHPDFGALRVRFRHGPWNFFTLRGPAAIRIDGRAGDLLSLLPQGGDVSGLSLAGCLYPLYRETLSRSRGLSNELAESAAALDFGAGVLMVMHRTS